MKLYLRHIFNSIKEKPIQPVLIMLTMMMCVVLFVVAFIGKDAFFNFNTVVKNSDLGDSDISITTDGFLSNFIQISDVEEAIGAEHEIFGYFAQNMAVTVNDNTVPAYTVATDMNNTKYLSEFKFLEKGDINTLNINDVAIINVLIAEKYSLSLGDTIRINFGENSKSYKVAAIALDTGILFNNEIMVNIYSITELMARETGLYFLGEGFLPYNNILIRLNGGSIEENIALIKGSDKFSHNIITNSRDMKRVYDYTQVQEMFVLILSTLMSLIAISFIYSTFSIVMTKRLYHSALFRSMGATKAQLLSLMLIESVFYSVIGGAFGLPLSVIALKVMEKAININAITYVLTLEAAVFAFCMGLIISVVSILISAVKTIKMPLDTMLKGETKYFRMPKALPCIILLVLFVIGLIILLFINVKYYYILGIILVFLFAAFSVFAFPFIFKTITTFFEYLLSLRSKKGVLTYIIKNTKRNASIQSITRVLMIVMAFFLMIAYAVNFASYTQNAVNDVLKGEIYIRYAFGMDENSVEKIRALENIESVNYAYSIRNSFLTDGKRVPVIVVDGNIDEVINFEMFDYKYSKEITGNEIIMPESLVHSMNKKIGDEIVINIVEPKTFIIADTIKTNYNFIILTEEGAKVTCDLLMIDTSNNNVDEVIASIKNTLNDDSVIIGKRDEINYFVVENIGAFINLAEMVLIIIAALAGAGILDSVINNYRQREQEFLLLKNAGMSKKGLCSMIAGEAFINFAISLVIAVITAYIMLELTAATLLSYGLDFKLW